MGYHSWLNLYSACPGRANPRKIAAHSDPRALPEDDGVSWRLTYAVCGESETAVLAWLEELTPPEGEVVSQDGPARRHGHICAVRTVVLGDAWFEPEPAAVAASA